MEVIKTPNETDETGKGVTLNVTVFLADEKSPPVVKYEHTKNATIADLVTMTGAFVGVIYSIAIQKVKFAQRKRTKSTFLQTLQQYMTSAEQNGFNEIKTENKNN